MKKTGKQAAGKGRGWFFMLAVLAAAAVFATVLSAGGKGELSVLRVTPSGKGVPPGNQVVIQFDRAVVPVGRMERTRAEVPVTIKPALSCKWRWLNTTALCCELDSADAFTPATSYQVKVRPGLVAQDGAAMAKEYSQNFETQRPGVEWAGVHLWTGPLNPVFRVATNMPVTRKSLSGHLYLAPQANPKGRVAITVTPEPPDTEDRYYDEGLTVLPDEGAAKQKPGTIPEVSGNFYVIPASLLAPDTVYALWEEPGLVCPKGKLAGDVSRQVAETCTFPPLEFLGVRYDDLAGNEVMFLPKDKCGEKPGADPLRTIRLVFSAPVVNSMVKENATFSPDLAGGRKDYDPWANRGDYSGLYGQHVRGQEYSVWLPELLKAARPYEVGFSTGKFKDQFGRGIENPGKYVFCTDHRRSRLVLPNEISVLEKDEDTQVPVYVTNLKSFTVNYEKLTPDHVLSGQRLYTTPVPAVNDISFAMPLKMREAIGGKGGLAAGWIVTDPRQEEPIHFLSQVTPFAVHAKRGFYNTLVWVKELESGRPVSGAKVSIFYDTVLQKPDSVKVLAETKTDKNGIAVLAGNEILDPQQQLSDWIGEHFERPVLQARVEKDGAMAVVPLSSEFSVQFQQWNYPRKIHGHMKAWGATAQGVYRTGDTIQYKIWVRNEANRALAPAPSKTYTLKIMDPMGKAAFERTGITLSEFGAMDGEFNVPKNAAMGWYDFTLSADFTEYQWEPMRVLVTDFTPAPFKVRAEINGELFRPGDKMEITAKASMHAGGPYANAPARISATLSPGNFSPETPPASQFFFNSWANEEDSRQSLDLVSETGTLDSAGIMKKTVVLPDKPVIYGQMNVEAAVSDDRGKYMAANARAEYIARDRLVGLKCDKWMFREGEPAGFSFLVVDDTGHPVPGVPVTFKAERQVTKASRVKGPGNAFVTQYIQEWEEADSKKLSSTKDPAEFSFTPNAPGSFRVTAAISDTKGRPHSTGLWTYVAGKGRVLWEGPEDNVLSIVPEKTDLKVGDIARFLVKNPFEKAEALITVERLGVISQKTVTWDTSTPVIELPVTPEMIPGFYLSVVAFSPRVEKPISDVGVDLGKPSFRIGYQAVTVKDPYKEIVVTVVPDRKKAKPGEKVTVKLNAVPRHPEDRLPIELAVAVLDESVFDLVQGGDSAFDPYEGFYGLSDLDLLNYNLLCRLVGRQKFEKKGQNQGGDGSRLDFSMRTVFKYVCFWNPAIKTDDKGNATISFTLPDNLTSFRVLAMAVTPKDRMGLGVASIAVSLPTEIRPVMPNQVMEKDTFQAGFSVMNRTDAQRDLDVSITAKGSLDAPISAKTKIRLGPFARSVVTIPVKTKVAGEIVFSARAWDAGDGDGVIAKVPVLKMRSLVTGATYGSFTGDSVSEKIAFPKDIWPDVGEAGAVLSPSVIGGLTGAFRYLRDYPYICWEQRLTKGVMASHYLNLRRYLPEDFSWPGVEGLTETMLNDASSFQAENGGMCYYAPRNEYVCPYLSAYTAICFAWLAESGRKVPAQVEEKLQGYLLNLLRHDDMPSYFNRGMADTVRAVALAALARRGKLPAGDLARFRPHMPYMSLFGKAHYLMATIRANAPQDLIKEAANSILASANQSGGKFQFVETLDDGYARILASTLRTNGAILSSMLALSQTAYGKPLAADVPEKLVRFITQSRKNRDHWENTQENMFCVNAVVEYARIYENTTPDATVTATLGNKPLGTAKFTTFRDPAKDLFRTVAPQDIGTVQDLILQKQGPGRIYYSARLTYAPKTGFDKPMNAGIEIHREYSVERNGTFMLLKSPMKISRGELVRVDLYVKIAGARNFVVVDDPVPGGLEPVNRDLATASTVDAAKGNYQTAGGSFWFNAKDWFEFGASRWCFYHQELGNSAARFYSEYLPPGNYHLSYTAQAISAGGFAVMPSKAEEMYDPDVFGKTGAAELLVK